MIPEIGDPAFYLKVSDGFIEGVMVIYVNDSLNAGIPPFENKNSGEFEKG